MGYVNPLFHYGPGNFFRDARSSGVDAVILPDLPPEEAGEFQEAAGAAGVDLVFLIAPTTPDERVKRIDAASSGFVYAVSVTGVTGSSMDASDAVVGYLDRIRGLVHSNPVLVGFGIADHEDFARLSAHADGCIVGSAFIRRVEAAWSDPGLDDVGRRQAVRSYVHELKYGHEQG
jgi:tryptophan synthase alpha chain